MFKEYDQRQHSTPHIGAIQCLNNGTLEKLKEEPSMEERREKLEIRTIYFGLSNVSICFMPSEKFVVNERPPLVIWRKFRNLP